MSIPKIIHYCWFGPNQLGPLQQMCLKSWKKHLSDYKVMYWNEENSPMDHPFVKAAYAAKKYAFVADYVRFYVLYQFGGVYLDTDMLILRKFDDHLISNSIFVGKEDSAKINGAIIGCVKKQPFINACLQSYNENFDINKLSDLAIPNLMSGILPKYPDVRVYSNVYFYPFPFEVSIEKPWLYKKYIQPESYGVHLWDASWIDGMKEYREGKSIWIRLKRFFKFRIK